MGMCARAHLDSILEVGELVAQGLLHPSMGGGPSLCLCPGGLCRLQPPVAALQAGNIHFQLLHPLPAPTPPLAPVSASAAVTAAHTAAFAAVHLAAAAAAAGIAGVLLTLAEAHHDASASADDGAEVIGGAAGNADVIAAGANAA